MTAQPHSVAYTVEARGPRANGAGHHDTAGVTLTPATSLRPSPIRWLWPGWLAAGKLHVLGGQPGTGKTSLAMTAAAIVSRGGQWPDGTWSPAGNVVIWSGEDDPTDTLLPRLIAAGADLGRVFFVGDVRDEGGQRPFDPARDMGALRERIAALPDMRLIVVDPIVSAVAGDSHKNAETRRGLAPLVDLASHVGAALLGITHFTKGTAGREPVERITGSLAFGALARVVMVAAREPDGEDGTSGRRILARAKSNIGPDEGGFAYRLDQVPMPGDTTITASIAVFGDAIQGTARDMLAVAEAAPDAEDGAGGALQEAQDFLADALSGGPVPVKALQAMAREAGQAWATVRRAKDALDVAARKGGMGEGWTWLLPEGAHQNTKAPTPNGVSTFGQVEHLRADAGNSDAYRRARDGGDAVSPKATVLAPCEPITLGPAVLPAAEAREPAPVRNLVKHESWRIDKRRNRDPVTVFNVSAGDRKVKACAGPLVSLIDEPRAQFPRCVQATTLSRFGSGGVGTGGGWPYWLLVVEGKHDLVQFPTDPDAFDAWFSAWARDNGVTVIGDWREEARADGALDWLTRQEGEGNA